MSNELQIKEKLLLKYHNRISECLIENNIEFSAEYAEELDPKLNSCVNYFTEINGQPRVGLICVNKGKFGGAIFKTERIEYLEKEGFTEEQIENEPILAEAKCPLIFILMLALPIISELEFDEEMWAEFEKISKKRKK